MSLNNDLLFGIDDRPPLGKSVIAAAAHLLAIVGGIATAPLIIARGLGLDVALTSYVIASALVISGVATFIQVKRFGGLGSGMLSVQGTSFAFVGVFIYAGLNLKATGMPDTQVLGTLIGTATAGGFMTIIVSVFLQRLNHIITLNVSGIVVFLLGLSLVWVAVGNLGFAVNDARASGGSTILVYAQALIVITTIVVLSTRRNPWLKLASILLGLLIGMLFAFLTGSLTQTLPSNIESVFIIQFAPFPLAFDPTIFLLLAPIFLVTVTESIGDLTATSVLSQRSIDDEDYWRRIRGGVMADGFNTMLAGLFGTFPNTTFSQNNGVIRLTGVASRFVGLLLAGMLVILGSIPLFSALFQLLPGGVLHGATGLMFAMIMLTGWRVLRAQENQKYVLWMLGTCTATALALTQTSAVLSSLAINVPEYVAMLTNFPVATGAFVAILWESLARLHNKKKQNSSHTA